MLNIGQFLSFLSGLGGGPGPPPLEPPVPVAFQQYGLCLPEKDISAVDMFLGGDLLCIFT